MSVIETHKRYRHGAAAQSWTRAATLRLLARDDMAWHGAGASLLCIHGLSLLMRMAAEAGGILARRTLLLLSPMGALPSAAFIVAQPSLNIFSSYHSFARLASLMSLTLSFCPRRAPRNRAAFLNALPDAHPPPMNGRARRQRI